jgi:hypothetical protein
VLRLTPRLAFCFTAPLAWGSTLALWGSSYLRLQAASELPTPQLKDSRLQVDWQSEEWLQYSKDRRRRVRKTGVIRSGVGSVHLRRTSLALLAPSLIASTLPAPPRPLLSPLPCVREPLECRLSDSGAATNADDRGDQPNATMSFPRNICCAARVTRTGGRLDRATRSVSLFLEVQLKNVPRKSEIGLHVISLPCGDCDKADV